MRPIICCHTNGIGLGGTEGMIQLLLKYMREIDSTYNFVLMYKAQEDRTREPFFEEILTRNRLIPYASVPEAIEIMKGIQPAVLHHFAAGVAEWPMIPFVKQTFPNMKFIQTAVFGNQNDQVQIDAVIYVSKWMQIMVGKQNEKNHFVIRNPIESPKTDEDLREELNIDKDTFVFGHVGRPDPNTYSNLNLQAYSKIENDTTCFILLGVDELAKDTLESLHIKNYRLLSKTVDPIRISKFYNTTNLLAHSRRDGEVNSAIIFEAMAHKIPVLSSYGTPFNGHIEQIQNAGFVTSPGDVDEYASLMRYFIEIKNTKKMNYFKENAYKLWKKMGDPYNKAKEQLDVYNQILS